MNPYDAAVEAMAGALTDGEWTFDGRPVSRREMAEYMLVALVASAEVREGLSDAVAAHLAERIRWHPPYGATSQEQWTIDAEQQFVTELNDGKLRDAILAALTPPEAKGGAE